jgi:hypothetical protein
MSVAVSVFIAPVAIKRVLIGAKFDIRALQAANDTNDFDRLEAL